MRRVLRILARPADNDGNPYVRLLYGSLRRRPDVIVDGFRLWSPLARHRPDVFLVQWPETAFDHSLFGGILVSRGILLAAALLRLRGTIIVWIAHNLQSHERRFPRAEDAFWKRFARAVDATTALSRAGLEAARGRHPALAPKPGIVVPHGHYRGVYPDTVDRARARTGLDLAPDARVVLFLGRILSYKNVPALVEAFRAGAAGNDVLLVVGRPRGEGLAREILDSAGNDPRVRTEFGFVEDGALQRWFRAADLCVLPFREILNSGSAILSLSFDLPVLVPDRGAMAELRDKVGRDWVRTYDGPLTPALLDGALRWATSPDRPGRADLSSLDWDAIGEDFARDLGRLADLR
jgi:beta-1,4-mannosyltransferase